MCYKIYSIIFWFFITLPCLANCEMINDNESVQYGLNSGGINAARHLLDSKVGDWKKLCGLPKVDLIKKLNAFVYNYCKKPMSNLVLSNINDLFDKCYTACGGRSYVLRGLLAVYGIKSDYRNIYNIPIQGNHSAVEVNLNNKLSFLDPTFGTFFSSQSAYDAPLSLDEIIFSFDKKKLKKHVYQSKKMNEINEVFIMPIDKIYEQNFNSAFLNLDSYIEHESSEKFNSKKILMLKANISLGKNIYSIGCLDSHNEASASACFLKHTNQLYSSDNSNQFISYNFNYIGSLNNQLRINILNFEEMQMNRIYEITFLFGNKYNKTVSLNLSQFGNDIAIAPGEDEINVASGLQKYTIHFKANKKRGELFLYLPPMTHELINLYAFSIKKEV